MKIKPEHFEILKNHISKLSQEEIIKHGLFVKQENKFKDFNVRMAWDCFWACNINDIVKDWYSYLNDEHLNTAILKACRDLNIRFE